MFIVFEGIDGGGKTSCIKRLFDHFSMNEIPVILTKEPTYGVYGSLVRGGESNIPDNILFLLDREEHVELVINPCLTGGKIVLCDRYYYSNAVYQGSTPEEIHGILSENESRFPKPDLTIIVDVPVDVSFRRIRGRNQSKESAQGTGIDRFESSTDKLEKIREAYKQFIGLPNVKMVNGDDTEDRVFMASLRIINEHFRWRDE